MATVTGLTPQHVVHLRAVAHRLVAEADADAGGVLEVADLVDALVPRCRVTCDEAPCADGCARPRLWRAW